MKHSTERVVWVVIFLITLINPLWAADPTPLQSETETYPTISYDLSKPFIPETPQFSLQWANKTPPQFAILILLDGARQDLIEKFVSEGLMPNVKRLFFEQGVIVEQCISIWPSSSIPAHTAITTSSYPDRNGIVSQRWVNPQKSYYRNYIGPGILSLNSDIEKNVSTVFEQFRRNRQGAVSVLELANRGTSLFIPGLASDKLSIANLFRVISLGQFGGKLPVIKKWSRDGGSGLGYTPRFIMVNCPEIDHVHHRFPTKSDEIRNLYSRVDENIGKVARFLDSRHLLNTCTLAIIADHGMADVSQSLSLQDLLKSQGLSVYVPKTRILYEQGNTDGIFSNIPFSKLDAFVCWGGNSDGFLYVKGKTETGAMAWNGEVSPALLKSYPRKNGAPLDLLSLLVSQKGVGCVAYKAGSGSFVFENRRGKSLMQGSSEGGWSYKVLEGKDPFRYDVERILDLLKTQISEAGWLEITCRSTYPLAPINLAHGLSHPSRSPAIAVVAEEGFDFIPSFLKTSIPGSHGGISRHHVVVPFMIRSPGLLPRIVKCARIIDVVPTLLGLLGIPIENENYDGRNILNSK